MSDTARLVAYDCRDHRDPKYARYTIRMFLSDGSMAFQADLRCDEPAAFAFAMADALGIPFVSHAPPDRETQCDSPLTSEPPPPITAADDGMLF
ncbi:MAG: hypothetical protein ACPGWS_07290 [Solirubrobacterales bacterium]